MRYPFLRRAAKDPCVAVVDGANSDIWVYDLQREVPIRLTTGLGLKDFPVWTPDGRRLIFELEAGGAAGIYWTSADGAGKAEKLIESKSLQSPGNFSSDGARLVYGELNPAREPVPTSAFDQWRTGPAG